MLTVQSPTIPTMEQREDPEPAKEALQQPQVLQEPL